MDLTGIVSGIFNQLGEFLSNAINGLISLLPNSPFMAIHNLLDNSVIAPYLGYINWIVPFDFAVQAFTLWAVSMAVYYVVSIALRWLKVIGD